MNHFLTRKWVLSSFLMMFFAFFAIQNARADLGYWSAALVGNWRHPSNGDRYRFNSNGSYVFTSGPAKARGGNLSHSGFWKIVQPTEKESGGSFHGPVALILRSRSRVVRESRRRRVVRSHRTFRILVDSAASEEENSLQSDYYIGGVRWKRVR